MRISAGGSQDINQLQSDAGQFRNMDFVVDSRLAFFGQLNMGAVAAEFSHLQLFNPAGTGVVLLVDGFVVSTVADMNVLFTLHGTQLTTGVSAWANKFAGGAAGNATLRSDSNVAQLGTNVMLTQVLARTAWPHTFDAPVILEEGEGAQLVSGSVNVALFASFWGREV